MERQSLPKKDWVLTQEAFDRLLIRLDPDRETAGQKYERIRLRLLKFFECQGARSPEDLFDITVNRVARRIDDGEQIRASDPLIYFYGVARNVLKERWEGPEKSTVSFEPEIQVERSWQDSLEEEHQESERQEFEQRLECLRACSKELPPETRQLVISYYYEQKGAKIANRKQLAGQMGVSLNTLRVRMHRIREKLEACILECLEKARGGMK